MPGRDALGVELDVQVYFLFDPVGNWPPVPSEGLRAQPRGDGSFELLETPFFVRNIAFRDIVSAADDGSGVLWVSERVRWEGHQTLRVTPRDDLGATLDGVLDEFRALGLDGEELEEYRLLALDVPPGTSAQPIKDLLVAGHTAGRWWYEESCIGAQWPEHASAEAGIDLRS